MRRGENYKVIKRLKIFSFLDKNVAKQHLQTVSSLEEIAYMWICMYSICYGKVKINNIKHLYFLIKL